MEFHIECEAEDIARYVFVPGAHDRAKKIAAHFDDARLVSDSRGYMVYTGTVEGIPMTACSTGMGGPQVAIGIEELGHLGADTFIRFSGRSRHADVGAVATGGNVIAKLLKHGLLFSPLANEAQAMLFSAEPTMPRG